MKAKFDLFTKGLFGWSFRGSYDTYEAAVAAGKALRKATWQVTSTWAGGRNP